jgi:CheY-like chemotaxis protein
MKLLLAKSGYTVFTAHSAKEAKAVASQQLVDVMVSDVGLSSDSGLQLMRDLKEKYGIKGIAVSGYAAEEDNTDAIVAGFTSYFSKPVLWPRLLKAIEELTTVLPQSRLVRAV